MLERPRCNLLAVSRAVARRMKIRRSARIDGMGRRLIKCGLRSASDRLFLEPSWQFAGLRCFGPPPSALTLLAGCTEQAPAATPAPPRQPPVKGAGDPHLIRIVSSLPRTGSARQQTDTIVNGIRWRLDEAARPRR